MCSLVLASLGGGVDRDERPVHLAVVTPVRRGVEDVEGRALARRDGGRKDDHATRPFRPVIRARNPPAVHMAGGGSIPCSDDGMSGTPYGKVVCGARSAPARCAAHRAPQ